MLRASFPRRAMMASFTAPVTVSAPARWIASISAQRSSRDPCLVTCPRDTFVPGLAVPRGQPRPRAQLPGVLEPGHLADLGDDDRGQHRADAGQLLDHLVTAVTGQQVRD